MIGRTFLQMPWLKTFGRLRSLAAIAVPIFLFGFSTHANEADQLVPRSELYCAALLTENLFVGNAVHSPATLNPPEFVLGRDPLVLDDAESTMTKVQELWREAKMELVETNFSRRLVGREVIESFLNRVRARALGFEQNLIKQKVLSDKFWTGPRVAQMGLLAALPAMFTAVTGWSALSLIANPIPGPSWLTPSTFMMDACLFAGGMSFCRKNLKSLGPFVLAIFSQSAKMAITNQDNERINDVDLFLRLAQSNQISFEFSERGPSMIGKVSEDVAKLLMSPPKANAVDAEGVIYRRLLEEALAASLGPSFDWLAEDFRYFRIRFLVYDDAASGERCLQIDVTLFQKGFKPKRNRKPQLGNAAPSPNKLLGGLPVPQGI